MSRIGIDVDGVLRDFPQDLMLRIYNKYTGMIMQMLSWVMVHLYMVQ